MAAIPSSIHRNIHHRQGRFCLVALFFLQAASLAVLKGVEATALSDEALITLHSRLLSASDLRAFHEQLSSHRRRLHLRGHHDEDSNSHYHDTMATYNDYHDDNPMMMNSAAETTTTTTTTMSEEDMMMENSMIMDQHEMEVKMDVCPDENDAGTSTTTAAVDCLGPAEHTVIMELLNRRHHITRITVDASDENGRFIGVLANTTSTDSQTAAYLQAHVHQMHHLEETGNKVRQWDPLYKAMFRHLEGIYMEHTFLNDGISVLHTGDTECTIELIQKHAGVISSFVEEGFEAIWREHQVPEVCYRGGE